MTRNEAIEAAAKALAQQLDIFGDAYGWTLALMVAHEAVEAALALPPDPPDAALRAAEARGREKGLEEAAKYSEELSDNDAYAPESAALMDAVNGIRARIRALKATGGQP